MERTPVERREIDAERLRANGSREFWSAAVRTFNPAFFVTALYTVFPPYEPDIRLQNTRHDTR